MSLFQGNVAGRNFTLPGPATAARGGLLAPYFSSSATDKSESFYRNHMLGTLDFTSSEHRAGLQFFLEHSLVTIHEVKFILSLNITLIFLF